jgi:sugar fermentation stimulation protein A
MTLLVPFGRPVVTGRLVRRYKRFFVDVILDDGDGRPVVAHTANTGAMTGLLDEGTPVLLTRHDSKTRTIPLELEAVLVDGAWASVNTGTANAFAARAVEQGLIPELGGFARVRREVSPSPRSRSRFDLCLESHDDLDRCFVEVKSVTLKLGARALFPDAVTERGRKHLDALARIAGRGRRAAMLYVNKRGGCTTFAPAADVDPDYARALRRAMKAGVEVYCVGCSVDARGLSFAGRIAVEPV